MEKKRPSRSIALRIVRVVVAAAGGTGVLAAVGAMASGVPGPGPGGSLAAAGWAPFARSAYLVGWPLALLAVLGQAGAFVVGRARRAGRESDGILALLQIGFLASMTVGASALFTLYNGLDLAGLPTGPDPGLLQRLGMPGRLVLDAVPATALHVVTLLLGTLGAAATAVGFRPRDVRGAVRGLGRVLDGIAMGAVLVWWSSGGQALGGALRAGSSQRRTLLLVAAGCALVGLVAERVAGRRDDGNSRNRTPDLRREGASEP